MKIGHVGAPLSNAAATSSAVADVAAAGNGTSGARSNHVHGRESFGASAGASAVADTASGGAATTPSRSDHRHSREAFGGAPGAETFGVAGSAGSATTPSRSDHVHSLPNIQAKEAAQGGQVATVTWTTAFSGTPVCVATFGPYGTGSGAWADLTSISTTGATAYGWHAIGIGATGSTIQFMAMVAN